MDKQSGTAFSASSFVKRNSISQNKLTALSSPKKFNNKRTFSTVAQKVTTASPHSTWKKFVMGAGLGVAAYNFVTMPTTAYAEEPQKTDVDKKQKTRLKRIFNKYASQKDESGSVLMTPEDFISSVLRLSPLITSSDKPQAADTNSLKILFNMVDTNEKGKINFSEFVILFKLLTTPESEFEVLFKMFDVDRDGVVSANEFKQVMLRNKDSIKVDFDFNCDLMVRFFGRDGTSQLSFTQFAQFMRLLQEEIRKQEFYQVDADRKGYITADQFGELMTAYLSKGHVSPKIANNLQKLKEKYSNVRITFAEYDAFSRVMSNITAVAQFLGNAAQKDGVITKESFSKAAKSVTGVSLSPLEISIIFKMFAGKDEDKLFKEDYEEFIRTVTVNEERRQHLYDLWVRNQIQGDTIKELTWFDRAVNATIKFTLKTLYGGISGAIGATAVYPIDMVKTRMQNQRFVDKSQQLYANSIDCFKKIYRNEGFKGLYRGLVPQLIGVAPEKAIKLVVNDALRDAFGHGDSNEIYLPLEILAGGGAGASQVVFTNPIEIIKIRLQVQGEIAKQTGKPPKGAKEIMAELGFAGLYKGASACFARDIPFSAIYFPTYAFLKDYLKGPSEKEPTKSSILLAGCIAGGLSASSTTPFDVIKTRLQVEARAGQDTYTGIVDCAKKVYAKEGFKAFWKGVLPRTVRSSPQFGVTLLAYELLHKAVAPSHEGEALKQQKLASLSVPMEEEELESLRELYLSKMKSFKKLFG